MRIAPHTTAREDSIEEYEPAHSEVPGELTDAVRAAGATSWTIWDSGSDLFHVLGCEDLGCASSRRW
ncbi:L-rhamnose mutarotase [Streptomyces rapamycinicus]|uniref:L-rhamnose mutarotase n=1 Tax=Streptomyces rhizosphaericus TaxID=114699 RepID=A0A6G4AM65_9ACTN|nr:L-rhamnose mutarotase [Streptomyces rhizosphaericus]